MSVHHLVARSSQVLPKLLNLKNQTINNFYRLVEIIKEIATILPSRKIFSHIDHYHRNFHASKIKDSVVLLRLFQRRTEANAIAEKVKAVKKGKLPISIFIGKALSDVAACGLNAIKIPPEFLIEAEDLPSHLNLKRIEQGEIQRKDWSLEFYKWINEKLLDKKPQKIKTQLDTDILIAYGDLYLTLLQHGENRKKILNALLGRELGRHILESKVSKKRQLVGIVLSPLLSLLCINYNIRNRMFAIKDQMADQFCKQLDGISALKEYYTLQNHLHEILTGRYSKIQRRKLNINPNSLAQRIKLMELDFPMLSEV